MNKPVEFKGVIVITTKELAKVYNCEESQIKQNFNNNKSKFIEGKHYYKLEGKELKEFKRVVENFDDPQFSKDIKFASVLYLWTHKGASRHCKMLGTDEAWEQFDILEENYFNPKAPQLSERDNAILNIMNATNDLERVGALKQFENIITKPLIEKIEENKPKVDVFDRFMNSKGLYSSTQVAKLFRLGSARKLNKILNEDLHLIYKQGKNWLSYANVDDAWFKVLIGEANGISYSRLKITPEGVIEIGKLLKIDVDEKELEKLL